MRTTHTRTEPYEALLQLGIVPGRMRRIGGDVDLVLVGTRESMVRYHSFRARVLTSTRYPGSGQYQVGSLTGAVAS